MPSTTFDHQIKSLSDVLTLVSPHIMKWVENSSITGLDAQIIKRRIQQFEKTSGEKSKFFKSRMCLYIIPTVRQAVKHSLADVSVLDSYIDYLRSIGYTEWDSYANTPCAPNKKNKLFHLYEDGFADSTLLCSSESPWDIIKSLNNGTYALNELIMMDGGYYLILPSGELLHNHQLRDWIKFYMQN